MMGTVLSAIAYDPLVKINLGPLSISPHGIGIAVGFLAGAWLFFPWAKERLGLTDDQIYSILTLAAIGSVVGARVAYVMNHFSEYDSLGEVLQVWKGGISLLGGFFGAIIFALPKLRSLRINLWRILDLAAPGMVLGVIIGRTGDLVVGDHLGKTTDFFLGYRCPPVHVDTASPCAPTDIADRTVGVLVHQTALYDLIFAIVIFTVLMVLRRRPRFDAFLICVFAASYAVCRLIEDFLREDLRRLGLTGSQWTALITLAAASSVLLRRRTPRWGRWNELPGGDDDGRHAARDAAQVDDGDDEESSSQPDSPAVAPTLANDSAGGDDSGSERPN